MAKKDTFRIVTRASDGTLRIRDFPNCEPILESHTQIGVDDSSTDLALRGLPVSAVPQRRQRTVSRTLARYDDCFSSA